MVEIDGDGGLKEVGGIELSAFKAPVFSVGP